MDEVHIKYFNLVRKYAVESKDEYEFLLPEECDFAPYKALVYFYMANKYGSVPEKIEYLTTNCSLLAVSLALLDLLYEPSDYSDLVHEMKLNSRRKKKVINVSKSIINKMDKLSRRYVLFPMDIRWFYEITRRYASPFWTKWDVPAMKKRRSSEDELFLWRRDGYAPLVYPKKKLPEPSCGEQG